ncbi:MAG: hypothetical protein PHP95_16920 [Desulfuromonadaceae bacterium]|nr:hypothetical protein [Desulfuromonadaceae bacterium]MDD2850135.1 hypothetical protein [Desulfuromonadaceae bacterium]MDD4132246.1 hypothetical protein [Desulfuromonadaceae bacterium]
MTGDGNVGGCGGLNTHFIGTREIEFQRDKGYEKRVNALAKLPNIRVVLMVELRLSMI